MTINGKTMNDRFTMDTPTETPWRVYAQVLIAFLFLASILYQSFVILPALQSASAMIRAERDAELAHLKKVNDARTMQMIQEATILLHHRDLMKLTEENLRASRDLSGVLRGAK